jgi:hypothetical protein
VTYPADWLELLLSEHVVARLSAADAVGVWEKGEEDVTALREEVVGIRVKLDELAEDYAEGLVTREQLRSGSVRLRERLEVSEGALAKALASTPVSGLLAASDVRSEWSLLDMERQRAVMDVLMHRVELKPRGRGSRKPDPELVVVHWATQEGPHPEQGQGPCSLPLAPQGTSFLLASSSRVNWQ